MKLFFRFIPLQLTICIVLGILSGYYIYFEPIYVVWILLIGMVVFTTVYYLSNNKLKQNVYFKFLVFFITFFLGLASITLGKPENKKDYFGKQLNFSKNANEVATIKILKILKPNNYSYKYEAEVIQVNNKNTSGKLLLNVARQNNDSVYKVDQLLLIKSTFNEIKRPLNPYSFNYKKYLKNQQINYQTFVDEKHCFNLGIGKRSLNGFASVFREKVNYSLKKYGFKANELAVINALLLGQRQTVSADLMTRYTNAGAIHILAVSGLHVGILLLILSLLFKPFHYFKNGKLIAVVCVVISLWLYAVIAGLSASVVRAVTMFTAVAIGIYTNRPSNIYNTLITSMFFLLLVRPSFLFDVGFQLSYTAVFAIVWIQPKLYGLVDSDSWLIDKTWQLFTVSLAAQIGVLPLSIYYFHQFPGLFFISNLVIIPFLGIILTFGVVVILLSLLSGLPQILADIYMFIIDKMNSFVGWVSNQEAFIIQNINFSIWLLIVSYVVIVVFFKWTEKTTFKRLIFLSSFVIIFQFVIIYEKYERQTSEEFIVFQKTKESIIGNRNGDNLALNSSNNKLAMLSSPVKNYVIGAGVKEVNMMNENQHLFIFNKSKIIVVDSLGIYNFREIDSCIVLLRDSPKINLERLLEIIKPTKIIADGSNYKSYVKLWKQTCLKNKTPFYSTLQNGAFMLKR